MSANDGWSMVSSGIFVSPQVMDGLRKAVEEKAKDERRKLFSDGARRIGGLANEVKTDNPDFGQMLSYYAQYQPWNLAGGWRKPTDTVPFAFLRDVARKSPIDRLIIDTRIAQLKRFARPVVVPGAQVGYRVVHERYADPAFHETDDIKARCQEVQRRLGNVTPEAHNSIRDFFSMMMEEELVVDRKVIVIYRDRGGRPEHFHAIDGTTVRPRLQILLPFMFKNKISNVDLAAEILSYKHNIDITKAAYVQEVDGQFVAAWTAEQMSVDITNPTARVNSFGYGQSLLEKSLESTKAFIYAWQYNTELFKTNFPEGMLSVLGDYDQQGLEAFKRQLYGEVGQAGYWRMPVIVGGNKEDFQVQYNKMRDSPKDMLFGELLRMLIAVKAAAYRMHPSEINFSSDMGAQQTVFGRDDTEKEVSSAAEQGLHTTLDSMADWLTRAIVKQNYDDLTLIWDGLNRPDENTLIANISAETAAYMTVDEARAKKNMAKLPDGQGAYINNPLFFQQVQMQMQEEQQKQQQEQYDQGDFGEPGPQDQGEGGQEEGQESAQNIPREWLQSATPAGKGQADTTQEGGEREPGQLPPEGNPKDAPFQNKAARGKKGQNPFTKKSLSPESYEAWKKSFDDNLAAFRGRTKKDKHLVIQVVKE